MAKWKAIWRKKGENPFTPRQAQTKTMTVEVDDAATIEVVTKMASEAPCPEGYEFFKVEKVA